MVANHVLCQLSYTPDKHSEISKDLKGWLRGRDLNPRPLGYEPNELPDCSTPRQGKLNPQTTDQEQRFQRSNSRSEISGIWWAWVDSNYRPHAYQACALTN